MTILHQLSDLPLTAEQKLFEWVLSPSYRLRQTRHGPEHVRYAGHSVEDLETVINRSPHAALLRNTDAYRVARDLLCPDERRPGQLLV